MSFSLSLTVSPSLSPRSSDDRLTRSTNIILFPSTKTRSLHTHTTIIWHCIIIYTTFNTRKLTAGLYDAITTVIIIPHGGRSYTACIYRRSDSKRRETFYADTGVCTAPRHTAVFLFFFSYQCFLILPKRISRRARSPSRGQMSSVSGGGAIDVYSAVKNVPSKNNSAQYIITQHNTSFP